MKRLLPVLIQLLFLVIAGTTKAQEFNFKNTVYYYRYGGDTLISTGNNLSAYDFSSADRASDSLFHDGIYFPSSDCFGSNLWIRIRHIANDPNGISVGINIPKTFGNPCQSDIMIGGWAGFLYDFEIHRDINLTGTRGNFLGALYPTSITVASLEWLGGPCDYSEWLSFVIMNGGSTGWSLNSINFTGVNPNSHPAFSDTLAVYKSGSCYPPDGFTYDFPTGSDSVSATSGAPGSLSEFKMSAGNVSHFRYGYEYSDQANGYQGMSMAFGSPPTYSVAVKDVTCKNGNDGEIQVSIKGGIGPFTYEWSDSTSTGDSLNALESGTYRLTVTDQNGCGKIADTTFLISEPVTVTVSLDSTDVTQVLCRGGNDGSIQVYANGTAPVTYLWNTGDTDSLLSSVPAGIYTATVTDAGSCWVTKDTIIELTTIDIGVTQTGNTLTSDETGAAYQWFYCGGTLINNSTGVSFAPTASGDYKVVVTKNGCTDTSACKSVTIAGINESSFAAGVSIYPNPVANTLFIKLDKTDPTTEVKVSDLSGRVVAQQTEPNKTIIILNLQQPAGVYFVTIKTNEGTAVKRVVKE